MAKKDVSPFIFKLDQREKEIIKEMIDSILLKHDARRWSQASAYSRPS